MAHTIKVLKRAEKPLRVDLSISLANSIKRQLAGQSLSDNQKDSLNRFFDDLSRVLYQHWYGRVTFSDSELAILKQTDRVVI